MEFELEFARCCGSGEMAVVAVAIAVTVFIVVGGCGCAFAFAVEVSGVVSMTSAGLNDVLAGIVGGVLLFSL